MVYDNKRILSKRIFVFIEMINKDHRIETLETANEKMTHDLKTKQEYMVNNKRKKRILLEILFFQKQLQEEIIQCKIEIKSRNKHITELEVNIKQFKDQINDLQNTILDMQQSKKEVITVGSI